MYGRYCLMAAITCFSVSQAFGQNGIDPQEVASRLLPSEKAKVIVGLKIEGGIAPVGYVSGNLLSRAWRSEPGICHRTEYYVHLKPKEEGPLAEATAFSLAQDCNAPNLVFAKVQAAPLSDGEKFLVALTAMQSRAKRGLLKDVVCEADPSIYSSACNGGGVASLNKLKIDQTFFLERSAVGWTIAMARGPVVHISERDGRHFLNFRIPAPS